MRTGADISHWQGSFNAAQYKASGEDFIILKATENNTFTDGTFIARWRAARDASLPRSAYHFARPGRASVDVQADYFINAMRNVDWQAGDSWALDLETNDGGLGPTQLVAWADRWCERVRAALPNRGKFYSYIPFIVNTMGNPGRIPGGCLGWVARYRTDTPYAPIPGVADPHPNGWPDPPHVWQCSNGESGCVKDVASIGRCDYNRMTDVAFAELFGGGEPDVNQEEHDALMWLRANAASLRDQGVRMTAHGDPDVPANRTVNNLANVLGKLDAVAGTLVEHSAEHDAHTDMLTALAPDALVQSILSGLVAQGVVIPADIDHALLVEDMKVALQGMTQRFEPIGFDG